MKLALLQPNCSDAIFDSLNLFLGIWEVLSVFFGPNMFAIDKYFEITSNSGVPGFPDRDMAIKGVLQLLLELFRLRPIASSATVLDMDVQSRDSCLHPSCRSWSSLDPTNCSDDSLNLFLGFWEALSVRFGPNVFAVDNHFEITSNSGVPDFPDRDLAIESFLQILFQLFGLPPVSSSATVLDIDVHPSKWWVTRFSISRLPGQAAPHRLSESGSGLRSEHSGGDCQTPGCDNYRKHALCSGHYERCPVTQGIKKINPLIAWQ